MKIKLVPFERKLIGVFGDDNNPIADPALVQQITSQMALNPALAVSMQNVFAEFCNQLRQQSSSAQFNITTYRSQLANVISGVLQVPADAAMFVDLTLIDREKYLALKKALDAMSESSGLSCEQVFSDMLMNPREVFV